jgi:hypothetical protein
MFSKPKRTFFHWIAVVASLVAFLCACSSSKNIRPGDIQSEEDSIILGRLRFLPGPNCTKLFQLPTFKLRNATRNTSSSFATPEWTNPAMGQSIEIPISRKANPGTHQLQIEVTEAPPQSVWLDLNLLTLTQFEVPKGLLVYFGTVEVEIDCDELGKHSVAHYVNHTISNEFEFEINTFREAFPEVYEMYKNKIIQEGPEPAWKEL